MATQPPTLFFAIALLAAAAAPQAAEATILSFTGTRENVNPEPATIGVAGIH